MPAAEASRQNGKLGGRPKGSKAKHTIEAELARARLVEKFIEAFDPIVDRQIAQAKRGDDRARKDLLDRALGKPKETIEHQGKVTVVFDE